MKYVEKQMADMSVRAYEAVTISAIELLQKMQKNQFRIGNVGGRWARMSELWNPALAA